MAIQPEYGLFIALTNQKLFGVVANQIAPRDFLPLPISQKVEKVAANNADKLVMVPVHEDQTHGDMPYPIEKSSDGYERRLRIWANPIDFQNPEKMVLVRETLYDNGETIVPDRMMVGPKAPVYAMMKMRFCTDTACGSSGCGEAPFSAVPCYTQGNQLFGMLRDPEAAAIKSRPEMFANGIRLLRHEDMSFVKDLFVHALAYSSKRQLPHHDCHHGHGAEKADLGGQDLQSLRKAGPS